MEWANDREKWMVFCDQGHVATTNGALVDWFNPVENEWNAQWLGSHFLIV